MLSVEKLKEFGANADEGLSRCMNNESFYFRLINMAINDGGFEALGKALDDGDLDAAFEEAHKLKGVAGNLSLTPIYDPVCRLTELLRNKTPGDYKALCIEISKQREKLLKIADE